MKTNLRAKRVQLEISIQTAVTKLVEEFSAETGLYPSSIEIDMKRSHTVGNSSGNSSIDYVVGACSILIQV